MLIVQIKKVLTSEVVTIFPRGEIIVTIFSWGEIIVRIFPRRVEIIVTISPRELEKFSSLVFFFFSETLKMCSVTLRKIRIVLEWQ